MEYLNLKHGIIYDNTNNSFYLNNYNPNICYLNSNMSDFASDCNKLRLNLANDFPFNLDRVVNMANSFRNCNNIYGEAICGNNVLHMNYAYMGCSNLTQAVCGDNVFNMWGTYMDCKNLTDPVFGPKVNRASFSYENTGVIQPVCTDNIIYFAGAYRNCQNLTGTPVCGNNVMSFESAYYNCINMTGSPVCGNNVTTMNSTYGRCNTLTGNPVIGDNVVYMLSAYINCRNLTGVPVVGRKVIEADNAYRNCTNISASSNHNTFTVGNNCRNMPYLFCDCPNLYGNCFINCAFVWNFDNAFLGRNGQNRLNVWVTRYTSTYYNIVANGNNFGQGVLTNDATNNCWYNATNNFYVYYNWNGVVW